MIRVSIAYAPRSGPSDHRRTEVFENPEKFDPERYIKSEYGVKDGASSDGIRDTLPFGAGRVRIYSTSSHLHALPGNLFPAYLPRG